MKGLSMYLSQRYLEKIPYENGQQEPAVKPDFNAVDSMDLNGTIQHEPASHPIFNHTVDLNESIRQETTDQPVPNHSISLESKMHSMGSDVSIVLSADDLRKVQVALRLLYITFFFALERVHSLKSRDVCIKVFGYVFPL